MISLTTSLLSALPKGDALAEPVWASRHIAPFPAIPRRLQSVVATCGLMIAAALFEPLSGGSSELHFHFFVMMSMVELHQDWLPFLGGLQFSILDHGPRGTSLPAIVSWETPGTFHDNSHRLRQIATHPIVTRSNSPNRVASL